MLVNVCCAFMLGNVCSEIYSVDGEPRICVHHIGVRHCNRIHIHILCSVSKSLFKTSSCYASSKYFVRFRLQEVNISRIYGITDKSVISLAKNSKLLRQINLRDCWRITDESIFMLMEYA